MGSDMKRATSADVARLSGVSRATVSYVLNDVPGHRIPADTRERILVAAQELGYVPSASAAALKRGRSNLVLLDTAGIGDSHEMAKFLSSFATTVREGGFTLVTYSAATSPLSVSEMAVAVSSFIVASLVPHGDDEVDNLRQLGIQYFDGKTTRSSADVRSIAFERGAALQVDVLAEAGHRSICFALPISDAVDFVTAARHEAACARAAELGLAVKGTVAVDVDLPVLAHRLDTTRGEGVTAVVASNDETAMAVLAAARMAGLNVPGDLAVIGFDDIPLARFAFPALTTIRLDSATVARMLATDMLIAAGCDLSPVTPPHALIDVVHRESV
jgi:DNA-binding LacI/PurR family transcriptional regulator